MKQAHAEDTNESIGHEYMCGTCCKNFEEEDNSNEHMKTHDPLSLVKKHTKKKVTPKKKVSCKECNRKFDTESDLTNHAVCHTVPEVQIEDSTFYCKKCGETLKKLMITQIKLKNMGKSSCHK